MGVYKNENGKLVSYDTTQIMGTDHLGIGKVDGETIIADPDGTLHSVTKNADMVGKTTTFNGNESIAETFADGSKKVTVFNADGSIVETLTDVKGKVTIKTITFNADGSITEEVSA